MTRSRRSGFSIFDLLVIIAIIGILIGLLLPAVLKVREAANRAKSQNNLKQLALAVHNYASTFQDKMPQGNDANNYSAFVYLLPYVEQDALFRGMLKATDFKKPVTDKANDEFRKVSIKVFLNQEDPREFVTEGIGATNYFFCAGSEPGLDGNNGIFIQGPCKYTIGNIPDGTSNTLMCGESLKGDGGKKGVSVDRQHVRLDKDALKGLKDDTGAQDFNESKNIAGNRGESWMDGRFLQSTFTATRKLNDERPDVDCGGAGGLSSLRMPAGKGNVNVALMDGSVRAIKPSISLKTWKNAADARDGNVLGDDW